MRAKTTHLLNPRQRIVNLGERKVHTMTTLSFRNTFEEIETNGVESPLALF
jgi:hypothetical protein